MGPAKHDAVEAMRWHVVATASVLWSPAVDDDDDDAC